MQEAPVKSLARKPPTCRWATKPMRHNSWARAWELQLLSLCTATTEAHMPPSPCSTPRGATTMKSRHTATTEQLLLWTTRERPHSSSPPPKKNPLSFPWNGCRSLFGSDRKNKNKKQKAQGAAESCGQDLGDQKNAGLPATGPDRPPLTSRDALHLKSSVHGAP